MATIDKEKLYPNWNRMQKLQEDITRKHLDLGEEMNITTSKGVSGKALVGCVGFASAAAVAIAYILGGQPALPQAPPADQQVDLTVKIRDQHGELMYIPAVTEQP